MTDLFSVVAFESKSFELGRQIASVKHQAHQKGQSQTEQEGTNLQQSGTQETASPGRGKPSSRGHYATTSGTRSHDFVLHIFSFLFGCRVVDSLDMTAAPHPRFFFSAGAHADHLPTPVEICCYIMGMGLEGSKQAKKETNSFLCYSEPSKSFSTSTQKECYKIPITPPRKHHRSSTITTTPRPKLQLLPSFNFQPILLLLLHTAAP